MTMPPPGYVLQLTEEALKPSNIAEGQCFLCGGKPTRGSGEHVFPRWLQQRHNLWDHKLTLINGTLLQYRNVRVPACEDCNNRVLSKTERYVSNLKGADVSNWSTSHSYEVGRWMAKIMIGILFKEAKLLVNRKQPELGSIFPPALMDEMFLLHLLVQSWRKVITFTGLHAEHPFTLYVYEIDEDDNYETFNLSTNLLGKSICMRFGQLGIAFVGDGGLQHHVGGLGPYDLAFQKVHPIQFDEIAARVHYKSALRDATHQYVHAEDEHNFQFHQLSVAPYSSELIDGGQKRVFRDWSDQEFAYMLKILQVPGWEQLLDGDGGATYTRLVDESGRKIVLQ